MEEFEGLLLYWAKAIMFLINNKHKTEQNISKVFHVNGDLQSINYNASKVTFMTFSGHFSLLFLINTSANMQQQG